MDAAQSRRAPARPTIITIVCVLGFLGVLFSIPLMFTEIAWSIGAWYPPYLGISVIVGAACMVGLWKMKRWAAITYTAFALVNQVVLFVGGAWNILALIIPGIVVAIVLSKYKEME
jgi:hypothetical protein